MNRKNSSNTAEKGNEAQTTNLSRRKFLVAGGAAATAFVAAPRHVLGGPGFIAPSEKITLAYIGCGTQGLREMLGLLTMLEIQIVAVCDPVKESHSYVDWSPDGLRSDIAKAVNQPDWKRGQPGIHGGRDVAKEIIEIAYGNQRRSNKFNGCDTYADFRELLEKQKDVNAVKVMTPDHLHATIAIAAMKKGKHVMMHKPLANRLLEARLVIETARKTAGATHFLPASDGANIQGIKKWIDEGAIGTLREIHNWSNRPVWPQYATLPTEQVMVPENFDWQLWLGPSLDRPYHPHYTNAVFRGWYEFGGGALADMGHYSLWPVFRLFDLDAPYAVESRATHICALDEKNVPHKVHNDYSFPASCTIRFQFAAKAGRSALDILWYDGSIKPPAPDELANQELEPEGMLFVGDKGKILAGFRGEDARLLSGVKTGEGEGKRPAEKPQASRRGGQRGTEAAALWVAACKGGPPTYGDFLRAGPISDAFNLGAISLRLGGRKLLFDSAKVQVSNLPEANKHLTREYRPGWELVA
jgi:predicted dehydrogenase